MPVSISRSSSEACAAHNNIFRSLLKSRHVMIAGADAPNRIGLLPNEPAPRPPPSFLNGNYKINWLNTSIVCLPPVLVLAAWLWGVELTLPTAIVGLIFYFLNGFG